ncbi:MAG: hypothetical protein IJE60_06570 [Tyzzerella sp.]|nr:hypothetical protein [Tyzzerella sp.]
MVKKWCTQNKESLFVVILLLCFCGYNISRSYGFVLFPDEFGYWTYASMLTGYDWSDIVSLGSYYSYGYSLILFPIFVLCKNAVIAYRMAIAVNFILLGVCFFIWKKLIEKLFEHIGEKRKTFYAAIAVFYPSWLFYGRITLAEIVIVTLYAAICLLLYDYLEYNRMSTLIILVLALVYIHFVHMRTIAVLIACVITLVIYYAMKKNRIKQCITFLGLIAIIFLLGYGLKEWIMGNIYAASDSVNVNDYAGQKGKIAYIFTEEGVRNLIVSVAGKVLYLGIASFGLAYFGMWNVVKKVIEGVKTWKEKKGLTTDKWFCLFVLLATAGAVMVNAIYTIHPGRVDALTYGRYHEYIMPILIVLGLIEISENSKVYRKLVAFLTAEGVMTALVTWSLVTYEQTNIHGYMMVGMSYLHQQNNFEPIHFFWQTFGIGAVLTCIVVLGFVWVKRHKGMEICLILLVALEMLLAVHAGKLYIDDSSLGAYRDTKIVQRIERLQEEQDREIYYLLTDKDYALISILQFMMRDEDIHIISKEEMKTQKFQEEDLLVSDYRNPLSEILQEQYDSFMVNGHFVLFYNE